MSRRITTIDAAASVSLPPEAVDGLGVEAGGELDVEIVGRALVVRSVDEARRSRDLFSRSLEFGGCNLINQATNTYPQLPKVLLTGD